MRLKVKRFEIIKQFRFDDNIWWCIFHFSFHWSSHALRTLLAVHISITIVESPNKTLSLRRTYPCNKVILTVITMCVQSHANHFAVHVCRVWRSRNPTAWCCTTNYATVKSHMESDARLLPTRVVRVFVVHTEHVYQNGGIYAYVNGIRSYVRGRNSISSPQCEDYTRS